MTVLDSCIVAKWYINEPDALLARKLLSKNEVFSAPSIIISEVISAFSRFFVGGKGTETAVSALTDWQLSLSEGTLRIVDQEFFYQDALELAIKTENAFHDCLYLALAQRENRRLITADKKFARKARSVHPETYLLSEL